MNTPETTAIKTAPPPAWSAFGYAAVTVTSLSFNWAAFGAIMYIDGPHLLLPLIIPAMIATSIGLAVFLLIATHWDNLAWFLRAILLAIATHFATGAVQLAPRIALSVWGAECQSPNRHACSAAADLASVLNQPTRQCDLLESGCRLRAGQPFYDNPAGACWSLLKPACDTSDRRALACPVIKQAATPERPITPRHAAKCSP
jgi:hypothetical protein